MSPRSLDRAGDHGRQGASPIASLLRTGRARYEGEFIHVPGGELVLRGPQPTGPPIVVAAGRPRMLRLAARLADEWNWWTGDPASPGELAGLVQEMERACGEVGRDPATLDRSIDLFSIAPPTSRDSDGAAAKKVADRILAWGRLGFGEARLDLRIPDDMTVAAAFRAMTAVVELVHKA